MEENDRRSFAYLNISTGSYRQSSHPRTDQSTGALSPTSFLRKYGYLDFTDLIPTEQQMQSSQALSTGGILSHLSAAPAQPAVFDSMDTTSGSSENIAELELDHHTWNGILKSGQLHPKFVESTLCWAARKVIQARDELIRTGENRSRQVLRNTEYGIFIGGPYAIPQWDMIVPERLRGFSESMLVEGALQTLAKLRQLRDEIVSVRNMAAQTQKLHSDPRCPPFISDGCEATVRR